MRRRYEVCSLVLVISFCLSMTSIPADMMTTWNPLETLGELYCRTTQSSNTPHSPITIIGDQNFTDTSLVEGWPGNGSLQNPFIIDGLEIDRGGASGNCISIYNTRVNFTISNCNLTGASIAPNAGIYLSNVTNARIINNNCSGNRNGIRLASWSNYNAIINNTCNANTHGISIEISNYTTIENNVCEGNGHGIYLEGAERCQLDRNRVNNSAWTGIYLIDSSFNTIANNTSQYNDDYGIHIFASHFVLVVNNTCRVNTWVGIYCQETSAITITNNTCEKNDRGVDMGFSFGESIIEWNIFESNWDVNAYDGAGTNFISYNYWSDYAGNDSNNDGIGDTPHVLPDAVDPYPLMYYPTPPRWVSKPHDVTLEHSDDFFHAYYEAVAPAPLTWWVSDGVHFNLSNDGHLSSKYILETITYNLRIVVSNIYGISISARFAIRVIEHIPPSWMLAPYDRTIEFHEAFEYHIAAIDPSGIAAWELNNTMQFALAEFYSEGGSTARLTNATVLSPGTYTLNISVFDTYDNKLSSILTVIVKPPIVDSTAPSWSIASLRDVIEFGEPFAFQLGAWDASGIDHWWISDSDNFSNDASGLIRNATQLAIGEYTLEVRAYDPHGNYCSAILIVEVVSSPTTLPPLDIFPALAFAGGLGIGGVLVIAILLLSKWQGKFYEKKG